MTKLERSILGKVKHPANIFSMLLTLFVLKSGPNFNEDSFSHPSKNDSMLSAFSVAKFERSRLVKDVSPLNKPDI